jgi:UDP-N-acetylmuramate--alanine ligase
VASSSELAGVLANCLQNNDLVLTQGAGNIGQLVKNLAATNMSIEKLKQGEV